MSTAASAMLGLLGEVGARANRTLDAIGKPAGPAFASVGKLGGRPGLRPSEIQETAIR